MATTVTVKGQVTLPKKVRDAAGIKPGDRVEVRATPSGAVIIEKPNARIDNYTARAYALTKRRLIRGITTDELMKALRGDPLRIHLSRRNDARQRVNCLYLIRCGMVESVPSRRILSAS